LFELYPAIDIRGGRCVRLQRGDFTAETVYDDDPVRVARAFERDGARWIHVVDLDAARTGDPENLSIVEAICAAVSCRVQTGGGVRGIEAAGALLGAGAARVVIGTAAVEQPALVSNLSMMHPGCVAVGLDARGRDVAVQGWRESTGVDVVELARRFGDSGASALIVTEIGRDGTMDGPALEQLTAVLDVATLPVIASGGVGTLADLRDLVRLRSDRRGLDGVIVGRALYEGKFTVPEALAVVQAAE